MDGKKRKGKEYAIESNKNIAREGWRKEIKRKKTKNIRESEKMEINMKQKG